MSSFGEDFEREFCCEPINKNMELTFVAKGTTTVTSLEVQFNYVLLDEDFAGESPV